MFPGVSSGTMRLSTVPSARVRVDARQMNDLPPREAYAPRTNSAVARLFR